MSSPSRSRRFLALAIVLSALLGGSSAAWAWNSTGHMLIASLAYDQMPPAVRAQWAAVLKLNPDFPKWEQTFPKDEPGLDFDRYLFMRASSWPDDIRKSGSPYDHPTWHYIDYPLEMPSCPMIPAPANTKDILFGLNREEKIVSDPAASPADRGAAAAWIIHLVGDIEQPLHCVTLVNATYPAPDGDRGGNLFFISLAGNPINLHFVWDSLAGSMMDSQELIARAAQLSTKFPRLALPELTQARDPLAWSLEGRALAIEAVYRHGTLPGGRDPNGLLPPLPYSYMAASRALADRRMAIGGYRLTDTLEQLSRPPL
jgi:hypothetical protein